MSKKKTHGEFMAQAIAKHGDSYDYSKTQYINALSYLTITCKEHGDFQIKPNNHLKGDGCPVCRYRKLKRTLYGFGINDLDDITTNDVAYGLWRDMIKRCYSIDSIIKSPSYKDCSVCEEWRLFSNFKRWFDDNYINGYELDKDILIKGNRVYSPEACCFVPQEINGLWASLKSRTHKKPLGVHYVKRLGKYRADISKYKKKIYLGLYENIEDAFRVYKCEKEKHIKEIADKYKDTIALNVYKAMCKRRIEITD